MQDIWMRVAANSASTFAGKACKLQLCRPQRCEPHQCRVSTACRQHFTTQLSLRFGGQFQQRRKDFHCRAVPGAENPPWTLDQIAGLAFGAFLMLTIYLAKEVDVFVARSQRRELGLCEECGGLFEPQTCTEWRCPKKAGL